eukprot:COSAG06_NODE_13277_length_1274_cov_2.793191_3_plen_89_part_01
MNSAQGPFFNASITSSTKTTVTIAGAAGFEGKVAMVRYGWDDMPSLFYDTQIAVCEYAARSAEHGHRDALELRLVQHHHSTKNRDVKPA